MESVEQDAVYGAEVRGVLKDLRDEGHRAARKVVVGPIVDLTRGVSECAAGSSLIRDVEVGFAHVAPAG